MTEAKKPDRKADRGQLRVDEEECKGCGLCIEACPPKVIGVSERLNHYGYRTARYAGAGCTGCGICFMVCPEPGAITVYRLVSAHEVEARVALENCNTDVLSGQKGTTADPPTVPRCAVLRSG